MPVGACVLEIDGRFTSSTDVCTKCATVRMFIQNVFVATDLSSRRILKTNRELKTTTCTETKLVRHLHRFKPHDIIGGILLVHLKEMRIHGVQVHLVCTTRPVIQQVLKVISRIGLIKRVKSDYELVR